jgi:riboflavin synthase
MFTGLIEQVGTLADVTPAPGGLHLRVMAPMAREVAPGDSISVNGVCLTATSAGDGGLRFDVGPETARVTTLGSLSAGAAVNLERAMRADSRFGGHFVQGHVDATGTVESLREEGDARWVSIAFPSSIGAYLVRKGSIAVDGISLTVADLAGERFDVMIIPFTWEHTNVPSLRPGGRVNLECDMVGKYVARAVELFAKP